MSIEDVRFLEQTPDGRGMSPQMYQEFLKLYKAMHLMQGKMVDLQNSLPVAQPDEYQVVVNGFAVFQNGEKVYATPA